MGQRLPDDILAVCISWRPENWLIPEVPFHCLVADNQPYPRVKTSERVQHLANRRNEALRQALVAYPYTKHVLMIDSYYLQQTDEIRELLQDYAEAVGSSELILGGSTWFLDKTHIFPKIRFWDNWITPEAVNLKLLRRDQRQGWMRVRAVGACYIFPRRIWDEHPYGTPSEGGEHVTLCMESGLPIWLDLNVQLWRDPVVYSWTRRFRNTLHLGRFRSHGSPTK